MPETYSEQGQEQSRLEQLLTLPPADRLRVVEQVVRDVAVEVTGQQATAQPAIWADESEGCNLEVVAVLTAASVDIMMQG